jgi:hypothetical protein
MKSLGASPNPAFLNVLEKAHHCEQEPKRNRRRFIVRIEKNKPK